MRIYLTIIYFSLLWGLNAQQQLYNRAGKISKDGFFENNSFVRGKQYLYDDKGNLTNVQLVEDGKIVRDSSVFIKPEGNDVRILEMKGVCRGKDTYVKNPKSGDSGEFCIKKIFVNGENYGDSLNREVVEIRNDRFLLKDNDTVVIKIYHGTRCLPQVMCEQDCYGPSLKMLSFQADNYGILRWTTEAEKIKGVFVIEEFRWNKWVKIGEKEGLGGKLKNEYSFRPEPHSGECIYRIRHPNTFFTSTTFKKDFNVPWVKFEWSKRSGEVRFSAETVYEIYDALGNLVKKGYGGKIDCSNLPKGEYYLNYDNSSAKFKV